MLSLIPTGYHAEDNEISEFYWMHLDGENALNILSK